MMFKLYFRLRRVGGVLTALLFALILSACREEGVRITGLTTEYRATPLGIDVEQPRFAWQMLPPGNERGYKQSAYRIEVRDPGGETVWDSDIIESDEALGIAYEGSALQPGTRYKWTVRVWDQDQEEHSASSWFETGLMNSDPGLSAWEGAQWIGGGDNDLVFYSHYQLIFKLKFTLAIAEGSTKASFVYGANDLRLRDRNKNIFQLENGYGESYIRLELDISALEEAEGGNAMLKVYRTGYAPEDKPLVPIQSFKIKPSALNKDNKNRGHKFEVQSAFGRIGILMDGREDFFMEESPAEEDPFRAFRRGPRGASVNLNPMGQGGDYLPFGMVCDMGFSMDPGQQAIFSEVEVFNDRLPGNTLFREDLTSPYRGIFAGLLEVRDGAYVLDGGSEGSFVVADPSRNSSPMLRTEFHSPDAIGSARLYVTARGIYEIYLNGEKVGRDYYNPDLTQYNRTHMYQTYDVSNLIRRGENALGAMLAEGWWSGLLSFGSVWNHFGDRQSLLLKLVLTYKDGSRKVITSNDRDWRFFGEGPVVYSSLTQGEVYDATREIATEGWKNTGFDDSQWKGAQLVPLEGTAYQAEERGFDGSVSEFHFRDMKLIGQMGNAPGEFTMLQAQSSKEVRDGIFVYDMGQNFVGVPRITLNSGQEGDTLILRYAEILYPDLEESGDNVGMIMTENYRAALCQDIYIMKEGKQVFQPRFTSRGYQYIEISGIDYALPLEAVEGVAISSITELSSGYMTSNEQVNRLWSNLVWSNVDNFLSIPTDCPQRNERMGWSGDISVFSRTATYVSQADQFMRRHLLAMRDVQLPGGKFTDIAPVGGGFGGILWGSAGITVPWETYMQYGDRMLLEEHYPAMKAYMEHLERGIDPETGLLGDVQLGDWLGPQNNQLGAAFLASAYHIFDLWIMKQVAGILGRTADVQAYTEMYDKRGDFFNRTFINDQGLSLGLIGGGRGFGRGSLQPAEFRVADTQTSYAVGLALGAFHEDSVPEMAKRLAAAVERQNPDDQGVLRPEYSLMTGFIGTAWISKALSDNGYVSHAYKLLQNKQYPSWLYPIEQGATSIWERLNGYTVENGFGGNNSMNSFNHYSFGAVGQWMMAYSLGIQRDQPGFKSFILQPEPDPTGEMTWAEGYYDSVYGRIYSKWSLDQELLQYNAIVPANTSATLFLPARSAEDILENGIPVKDALGVHFLRFENGKAVFSLESGEYIFQTEL